MSANPPPTHPLLNSIPRPPPHLPVHFRPPPPPPTRTPAPIQAPPPPPSLPAAKPPPQPIPTHHGDPAPSPSTAVEHAHGRRMREERDFRNRKQERDWQFGRGRGQAFNTRQGPGVGARHSTGGGPGGHGVGGGQHGPPIRPPSSLHGPGQMHQGRIGNAIQQNPAFHPPSAPNNAPFSSGLLPPKPSYNPHNSSHLPRQYNHYTPNSPHYSPQPYASGSNNHASANVSGTRPARFGQTPARNRGPVPYSVPNRGGVAGGRGGGPDRGFQRRAGSGNWNGNGHLPEHTRGGGHTDARRVSGGSWAARSDLQMGSAGHVGNGNGSSSFELGAADRHQTPPHLPHRSTRRFSESSSGERTGAGANRSPQSTSYRSTTGQDEYSARSIDRDRRGSAGVTAVDERDGGDRWDKGYRRPRSRSSSWSRSSRSSWSRSRSRSRSRDRATPRGPRQEHRAGSRDRSPYRRSENRDRQQPHSRERREVVDTTADPYGGDPGNDRSELDGPESAVISRHTDADRIRSPSPYSLWEIAEPERPTSITSAVPGSGILGRPAVEALATSAQKVSVDDLAESRSAVTDLLSIPVAAPNAAQPTILAAVAGPAPPSVSNVESKKEDPPADASAPALGDAVDFGIDSDDSDDEADLGASSPSERIKKEVGAGHSNAGLHSGQDYLLSKPPHIGSPARNAGILRNNHSGPELRLATPSVSVTPVGLVQGKQIDSGTSTPPAPSACEPSSEDGIRLNTLGSSTGQPVAEAEAVTTSDAPNFSMDFDNPVHVDSAPKPKAHRQDPVTSAADNQEHISAGSPQAVPTIISGENTAKDDTCLLPPAAPIPKTMTLSNPGRIVLPALASETAAAATTSSTATKTLNKLNIYTVPRSIAPKPHGSVQATHQLGMRLGDVAMSPAAKKMTLASAALATSIAKAKSAASSPIGSAKYIPAGSIATDLPAPPAVVASGQAPAYVFSTSTNSTDAPLQHYAKVAPKPSVTVTHGANLAPPAVPISTSLAIPVKAYGSEASQVEQPVSSDRVTPRNMKSSYPERSGSTSAGGKASGRGGGKGRGRGKGSGRGGRAASTRQPRSPTDEIQAPARNPSEPIRIPIFTRGENGKIRVRWENAAPSNDRASPAATPCNTSAVDAEHIDTPVEDELSAASGEHVWKAERARRMIRRSLEPMNVSLANRTDAMESVDVGWGGVSMEGQAAEAGEAGADFEAEGHTPSTNLDFDTKHVAPGSESVDITSASARYPLFLRRPALAPTAPDPLPPATSNHRLATAMSTASRLASTIVNFAVGSVVQAVMGVTPASPMQTHLDAKDIPTAEGTEAMRAERSNNLEAGDSRSDHEADRADIEQPAVKRKFGPKQRRKKKGVKRKAANLNTDNEIVEQATEKMAFTRPKRLRLDPLFDPSVNIFTSLADTVKRKTRGGRGSEDIVMAESSAPAHESAGDDVLMAEAETPIQEAGQAAEPALSDSESELSSVDSARSIDSGTHATPKSSSPVGQASPNHNSVGSGIPPSLAARRQQRWQPSMFDDAIELDEDMDSEAEEAAVDDLFLDIEENEIPESGFSRTAFEAASDEQVTALGPSGTAAGEVAPTAIDDNEQEGASMLEDVVQDGHTRHIAASSPGAVYTGGEVQEVQAETPVAMPYMTPGEMEEGMIGFDDNSDAQSSHSGASQRDATPEPMEPAPEPSPPPQIAPPSPEIRVKIEESDSNAGSDTDDFDADALGQAFLEYLPQVIRPRLLGNNPHGVSQAEIDQIGREVINYQARQQARRNRLEEMWKAESSGAGAEAAPKGSSSSKRKGKARQL